MLVRASEEISALRPEPMLVDPHHAPHVSRRQPVEVERVPLRAVPDEEVDELRERVLRVCCC